MKTLQKPSLFLMLFLFIFLPTAAVAQEQSQTFTLPEARVGEPYRADIEGVLRDNYRLRLAASTKTAIIQWMLWAGELAPGLSLRANGILTGTPLRSSEGADHFQLKVTDVSSGNSDLILNFALPVKAGKLRLVRIEGPRLVPIDGTPPQASYTGSDFADEVKSSRATTTTSLPRRVAGPTAIPDSLVSTATVDWNTPGISNHGTIDISEPEKSLDVNVVDDSRKICLLNVVVQGSNKEVLDNRKIKVDYNNDSQSFKVPLVKGTNYIFVSAWEKKDEKTCDENSDLSSLTPFSSTPLDLIINCKGKECGKATDGNAAKQTEEELSPFSSINTRALVGIEQSGASSAASEQNPFIDFFFNTPLHKGKENPDKNPRFSMWGDVRLTSTPQQVSAFISSTANVAGAAKADKINDIATSFDFKFGPEIQLNPDARNRLSFIAGFGASSPLTEPTGLAQIFKVPTDPSNSQFANFFADYPEAKGKTYIAFVRPERDRFMRQYFAGLRFKSYHYDGKGKPENRFPSMFDVTVGQNAAVTGGHLHKFVMSFDGSYQLPLKNALYIFGSANLKFGGDKFIKTPYTLDPAESTITLTSPNLVTTSRQLNRDSYRIGFAVDLVGLFKPSKPVTKDK